MIFFNVDFNNENKFLSLAYGCRNNFAVFSKFDANAVSILIFRKHAYAHFNVSLWKTVHADVIIFPDNEILASNKFYRH